MLSMAHGEVNGLLLIASLMMENYLNGFLSKKSKIKADKIQMR